MNIKTFENEIIKDFEFPFEFYKFILFDIYNFLIDKIKSENLENIIDINLVKEFISIIYNLLISVYNGSTCIEIGENNRFLINYLNDNNFKNIISNFLTFDNDDRITPFKMRIVKSGNFGKYLFYRFGDFVNEKNIEINIKERIKVSKDVSLYNYLELDLLDLNKNLNSIIENILQNNLVLITGGPGSGKTTLASKIFIYYIKKFKAQNNFYPKIFICAPTGKATNILWNRVYEEFVKEIKDIENFDENFKGLTIHKLLGYSPQKGKFKYNKENKLDADLIIVDEASMIDLNLFSSLLDAISLKTKIIILGDKDQLPSVDCGNVFGDIIQNEKIYKVYLKGQLRYNNLIKNFLDKIINIDKNPLNYENSSLSGISYDKLWNYIKNDLILLNIKDLDRDKNIDHFNEGIYFLETQNELYIYKLIDFISFNYSNNFRGEKFFDNSKISHLIYNFSILTLTNKGTLGCENINDIFLKYYNDKFEIKPAIILENDYENEVFNGDSGIIYENYFINNDGRKINLNLIKKWDYSFAITVHKSQGSSYDDIYFILPFSKSSAIISRELIYTAISRARKRVFILGKKEIFIEGIIKNIKRESGLKFI